MTFSRSDICQRVAKIRMELTGPRGKSSFAKMLGISPSTYDYYESSRVPPADVLVRIADAAGVDLRWLLTGQAAEAAVPPGHPVLRRAAELLSQRPQSAAPLAAFLDVLAGTLRFPAKPSPPPDDEADAVPERGDPRNAWVPVLGRSAAGIPQFWSRQDGADARGAMEQMLARHARRRADLRRPALASAPDRLQDMPVQVITLHAPDESDVVEYVAAAEMKARHPDAFAVRIDGQSMSPEICHGDLVILSPSAPAADGQPAVVQLRQQIGVTCKVYRRQDPRVHLVPVHEQFAPQTFPAEQVVWALRVLARVRPS